MDDEIQSGCLLLAIIIIFRRLDSRVQINTGLLYLQISPDNVQHDTRTDKMQWPAGIVVRIQDAGEFGCFRRAAFT